MKAYDVYLNNKLIDTVFWDDRSTNDEVKRSLIDHDRYNLGIKVREVKR